MRRIIICSDGTWNKPDQKDRGKRKPSNVVKITRSILPQTQDGSTQIVFYDEGVGTGFGFDKILGGGTGMGLSKNIITAYRFLVHNYQEGDKLFFFGFSRGAYTVRSLAGLIEKIGLLPKDHAFFMPEGYKLYREEASQKSMDQFQAEHHCSRIKIKFVGVWDTVGALGIPIGPINRFLIGKYQFHDIDLAPCIENGYQALAIDERRKAFRPAIWEGTTVPKQHLEQVWFTGVHTNIGGGYEHDGLANVAMHWMKQKAMQHGLEVDEEFLKPYRAWHKDELRVSMKGMYRILGNHVRPIGEAVNGNESIDPSAIDRLYTKTPPKDGPYHPTNLEQYLTKHPPL